MSIHIFGIDHKYINKSHAYKCYGRKEIPFCVITDKGNHRHNNAIEGVYYYSDEVERSIAQVAAYAIQDGYTDSVL